MSEEIPQFGNENAPKFIGKTPPAFQEALKQVRGETKAEEMRMKDPFGDIASMPQEVVAQPQQQNVPRQEVPRQQVRPRVVGSPALEEILSQLRSKAYNYDEIRLPSLGVFYNGGDGPLDGILHLRPMTGEEEQILASPKYMKKGVGINMIFQRCVKETIKADELLAVDRTYLLIAIRNVSYSHEYEVEIKCPDCGKKSNNMIRLDQLIVNTCPENFRPPLIDALPKSSLNFTWHLPRGKDENMVTEYREKRAKEYGDAAVDDSLLYRIALMLDNLESVRDKTELMILLKKLPIQDVAYLRSIASDPPFGVDTKINITCPICYHDFDVELPLEAGFFFPRHKRKEATDSNSTDI
jgi:hypothetical protein